MRVFSANGLVALVISQIAADEKGSSLKASLGIGRRAAPRPGWVGTGHAVVRKSSRLCENADELKIGGNLVQVHAGILSFSAKTRFDFA
jgi:hypothetical protein